MVIPPPRPTIYALSSGRPPAAIAVVRLSGPQAGVALTALTGRLPEPRRAALARVRDPGSGELIDEALALWFPGPRSETGEDMAELQLHGGAAVVAATFAALQQIDGLRLAEPGEFTRRAFEAGRLDLTAVEGLADLIGADTEAQRRQALRQMQGLLGDRAEAWRQQLIAALAQVEARIDFADEADVPDDLMAPALQSIAALQHEIQQALAGARRGARLRDGLTVAIAGPPNAGKSTLLNRLARRDAAIVSPHAGTTRDIIEVPMDLGGFPVILIDTAGIRPSDDPVEQEGIRRAEARARDADLVLWLVDAAVQNAAAEGAAKAPVDALLCDAQKWIVRNKIDLAPESGEPGGAPRAAADGPDFAISAATGAGLDALTAALEAHARDYFSSGEAALVTRERQRQILAETEAALRRALAEPAGREEVVAEDLRVAATALGRLTGRIDVEDILDVIFRDFCIGK